MKIRMDKHVKKSHRLYTFIDQFSIKTLLVISIHVLFLLLILWIDGSSEWEKLSLFAFLSTITLWVSFKIPIWYVAGALIVFLIFML